MAAAKVVAGVTERVGRYAVVEVTMVDFATPTGRDLFTQVANTPHRAP